MNSIIEESNNLSDTVSSSSHTNLAVDEKTLIAEPFPIHMNVDRYLIYDVNVVSHIRTKWHMCGCLIGTLAAVPQQNIFLGLPLELMVEEAAFLVEKGAAFTVDDASAHVSALVSIKDAEKHSYISQISAKQDEIGRAHHAIKEVQKQHAMARAKASGLIWRAVGEGLLSDGDKITKANTGNQDCGEKDNIGAKLDLFDDSSVLGSTINASSRSKPQAESPLQDTAPSSASTILADRAAQFHIVLTTTSSLSAYKLASFAYAHDPNPSSSRYIVYKKLHSKGYFLSPGLRFGCQFLAYPGDPLRYHSHFLVNGFDWDEKVPMIDLVGSGRLGTGVKKAWLIGGSSNISEKETTSLVDEGGENTRVFCIEWAGFG